MAPVKIVTDSACDLPSEMLEGHEIAVVPLIVRIGEEEFRETDLDIEKFWAKVTAARKQGLLIPKLFLDLS